jgi:hypothetical protein
MWEEWISGFAYRVVPLFEIAVHVYALQMFAAQHHTFTSKLHQQLKQAGAASIPFCTQLDATLSACAPDQAHKWEVLRVGPRHE